MKCIKCGAATWVVETRDTRRRRQCFNEHRFTTIELPAEVVDAMNADARAIERMRDLINERYSVEQSKRGAHAEPA